MAKSTKRISTTPSTPGGPAPFPRKFPADASNMQPHKGGGLSIKAPAKKSGRGR